MTLNADQDGRMPTRGVLWQLAARSLVFGSAVHGRASKHLDRVALGSAGKPTLGTIAGTLARPVDLAPSEPPKPTFAKTRFCARKPARSVGNKADARTLSGPLATIGAPMHHGRRLFLLGSLAAFLPTSAFARACKPGKRSPKSELRSADLLWTALPGQYIRFSEGDDQAERDLYERERAVAVGELRARGLEARAKRLENMGFEEFRARMTHGVEPEVYRQYSGSWLDYGHVAIVERDKGNDVWIVEALWGGVHRVRYDDWLEGRNGVKHGALCHNIWHARPRRADGQELSDSERDAVVFYASEQARMKRPYSLAFAGSLDNEKSFYCSKLIWLSFFKGAGFALDGDVSTDRDIVDMSPKKLQNRAREKGHLMLINDPGEYGSRKTK